MLLYFLKSRFVIWLIYCKYTENTFSVPMKYFSKKIALNENMIFLYPYTLCLTIFTLCFVFVPTTYSASSKYILAHLSLKIIWALLIKICVHSYSFLASSFTFHFINLFQSRFNHLEQLYLYVKGCQVCLKKGICPSKHMS